MYSIAEYMRMIKKWFSDGYNERNCHKGTMWEAVYGDRAFAMPEEGESLADLRDTLAYVHLNPIRAGLTDRFDGYPWSSYSAYRHGDGVAIAAMRRAYPGLADEEIVELHELRMSQLLEEWKLRRAQEIARKRIAGYEIPSDEVTDECMVAQAKEQIERIQKEVMDMQLKRTMAKGAGQSRSIVLRQIIALVTINPECTSQSLSGMLKVPLRTIQRYIAGLARSGTLRWRQDGWHVSKMVA